MVDSRNARVSTADLLTTFRVQTLSQSSSIHLKVKMKCGDLWLVYIAKLVTILAARGKPGIGCQKHEETSRRSFPIYLSNTLWYNLELWKNTFITGYNILPYAAVYFCIIVSWGVLQLGSRLLIWRSAELGSIQICCCQYMFVFFI